MKNKFWFILPFLLLICLVFSCKTRNYDVIVQGGTIFDGSGSPGYCADIGIREGRILKIGRLKKTQGTHVIDAGGKFVAPGFIDIHTHCDRGIRDQRRKDALNYLSQGVTTLVGGNCGGGDWPQYCSSGIRLCSAASSKLRYVSKKNPHLCAG